MNKPRKWTTEELNILYTYYTDGGSKRVIAEGLNRSVAVINKKARELGLKVDRLEGNWTDTEVRILNKYYSEEGAEGCISRGY